MENKIARNLSLKQFRAFVSVAKCGSFSEAAQELAISQPALSLSIQQFEEIVGVLLLSRTTRSVSLTPLGQEFLPKAEKILADVETAILSTRTSAEKQKNRVSVAVLPSVAIRVLPQAIRSYLPLAPEVKVHMQDDNGRGVEAQVLKGEADFGISNSWSDNAELEYRPFLRDQVGLICRGDHKLARRKNPLTWSDLTDLSFVGMAPDTGTSRLTKGVEGLPTCVLSPDSTVLTIAALVGIIESGEAVSALPALAAPDYLNPSLVYRSLSEPVLYRKLQLITPKNRLLPSAAGKFIEFLLGQSHEISSMFPNYTVKPVTSAA
ncbi:LysR family transcriptional regulator [Roseovarius sp. EL26]|uniref:LysR family transcriptional regulator n=1 Tax=Roseovarius sp. EL26 TaxID=2126672 RepID=UPI000EA29788|nr:LysR family transcriptional regulator [Roseovarius sp. EL26]